MASGKGRPKMAKAAKTTCDRCESRITVGNPFCGSCGYPTTWASHDERAAWEVAQYREKTMSAPISKIADDAPRTRAATRVDVVERPKAPRERKILGSLFGRRRAHTTTISLPEPKRVEPPTAEPASAPVLTMVRPEPEPVVKPEPKPVAAAPAIAPKPVVAPKPVAPVAPRPTSRVRAPKAERTMAAKAPASKADGLVSKVERAMNDNEALIDTPATVLAMRLLNQRVRELDEKVQRLERELEAAKATPAAAPETSRNVAR